MRWITYFLSWLFLSNLTLAQTPDSAKVMEWVLRTQNHIENYDFDSAAQTSRALLRYAASEQSPRKLRGLAFYNRSDVLLRRGKADSAVYYARKALPLLAGEVLKHDFLLNNYSVLGRAYYALGNYDSALYFNEQAYEFAQLQGDTHRAGKMLSNIGVLYDEQGNYPKALDYYFRSLRIVEKVPDSSAMGYATLNIGTVYQQQEAMQLALQYTRKAEKIFSDADQQFGRSIALGNLAEYYLQLEQHDSTRYFGERALQQARKVEDQIGIEIALKTLGQVALAEGDFATAKKQMREAKNLAKAVQDAAGLVSIYTTLTEIYLKENANAEALHYARKADKIAQELGSPEKIRRALTWLTKAEEANKNYKEAFAAQKKLMAIKDSVFNEKFSTKIATLRSEYEIEKKQEEVDALAEQNRLRKLAHDRQVLIRNLLGGALLVFFGFAYFLWRSRQREKRARQEADAQRDKLAAANKIVTEQKAELSQQHDELQTQNEYLEAAFQQINHKNKAITASINYAQRIQQAMLPAATRFAACFREFFVLFRPRDVVSGDFYWLSEVQADGSFVFILADCTGHGVPGALMSMAGDAILNQLVNQQGMTEPATLLDALHVELRKHLHQDTSKNQDGMDAAVCYWQPEKRQLAFAGAKMPILLRHQGQWHYERGDRLSVGGKRFKTEQRFTTRSWHLPESAQVYLFSDGFSDQFGGEKNRKITTKRLRRWVETSADQPLSRQQEQLEQQLDDWMRLSHPAQIDDISLLGVKL